jgi:uncharacterized repeat protein (TIGR02543 family)
MTVYARWVSSGTDPSTIKVTFNANGGKINGNDEAVSTLKGDFTVKTWPADPVRDGYKFTGWFTDRTGGNEFTKTTAVTGDMFVYAHWQQIGGTDPGKITVTFDANGGKINGKDTTTSALKADYTVKNWPANPVQMGYKFTGWYTAKTGGTEFTKTSTVAANTTVYAHWQQIGGTDPGKITVTFDANGGKINGQDTTTSALKTDYTVKNWPDDPVQAGYKFIGWYTAKTGGTEFTKTSTVSENMTVYAIWSKGVAPGDIKVTFDANGGKVEGKDKFVSTLKEDYTVKNWPNDPVLTGAAFLGWYTDKTDGVEFTKNGIVFEDMTVYAIWKKIGDGGDAGGKIDGGNYGSGKEGSGGWSGSGSGPKTGDDSLVGLWFILLAASAAALCITVTRYRRRYYAGTRR